MDTPIEESVKRRSKRKRLVILLSVLLLIILLLLALRTYVKPSISKSDYTTTVAQKGDIENTLNAMGEVLPEFEEVLTSPINAAVREVHMTAGTRVTAGESILTLDKAAAQTEYDKLAFHIQFAQQLCPA